MLKFWILSWILFYQSKVGFFILEVGEATVNYWFPLNNFSLLWPVDTKLTVLLAFIKRQLGIFTQVFDIKVKVTVAKYRNAVSAQ